MVFSLSAGQQNQWEVETDYSQIAVWFINGDLYNYIGQSPFTVVAAFSETIGIYIIFYNILFI